nr:TPA_asm: hypothetical protein HUJ06_013860 [Nelumbo nucifera]
MDFPSHFHKAVGHDSHRSTLLEGDGKNVGSLLHFNYALDGTTDEEKYFVIFGGHEGDLLKLYKVFKIIYQIIPKHPKSSVICSIEYEKLNESVPDPTDYVTYGGKVIEGLDGIVLQD